MCGKMPHDHLYVYQQCLDMRVWVGSGNGPVGKVSLSTSSRHWQISGGQGVGCNQPPTGGGPGQQVHPTVVRQGAQ